MLGSYLFIPRLDYLHACNKGLNRTDKEKAAVAPSLFTELPRRRVFSETLGIRRAGVVRPRPPLSNLIPGLRLPAPGSTLSLPQLPPYSPRCPLPQIPHIPPPGPHTSRLP